MHTKSNSSQLVTKLCLTICVAGIFFAATEVDWVRYSLPSFRNFLQAEAAPLPNDRKLLLKGTFSGWKEGVAFQPISPTLLQASISLHPGRHEFKIADQSWAYVYSVDASQATVLNLGTSRSLVPAPGTGNNTVLKLNASSTYVFQIDISDVNNPKVSVSFGGPYSRPTIPFSPDETRSFGRFTSAVSVASSASGQRSFQLFSDAPQRDGVQVQTLGVVESSNSVQLRSGTPLLDSVFALAVSEAVQNETRLIRDGAFNRGAYIPCDCYVTGEKWGYVWTRDTAYSADLGLSWLNSDKTWNSLMFKTSGLRTPGAPSGLEIVQDTGTGGSWPVSTDRVTWVLGADAVLRDMELGAERTARLRTAYEAARNSIERDRVSIFDNKDGLYLGEQSFLDWREQSYPYWTRSFVSAIADSKSLSTNTNHLLALQLAADWAQELGDSSASLRYSSWASALKASVRARFYDASNRELNGLRMGGNFPLTLSGRKDLLSTSLAVIAGIITDAEARTVLSKYPVTDAGSPVVWPQSVEVPIYHNRAIWPFVSAYSARAGRKAKHPQFVHRQADSIIRVSALHQSNMENLEFISGDPLFEDGSNTGPVINSKRQLWSVAATLSLFRDTLFGVTPSKDGVSFAPFVPSLFVRTYLPNQKEMKLLNLPVNGKRINLTLKLPNLFGRDDNAAFSKVLSISVNGRSSSQRLIPLSELSDGTEVVVELDQESFSGASIADLNIADPYNVTSSEQARFFQPQTPSISQASVVSSGVQLTLDARGASGTTWDVFRNGQQIASNARGNNFKDDDKGGLLAQRCYVVVQRSAAASLPSQPSPETCVFVGDRSSYDSRASTVSSVGRQGFPFGSSEGTRSLSYTPYRTGTHTVSLEYSNSYNDVSSGITAATRKVQVIRSTDGQTVFNGIVTMPHLPRWDVKGVSSSFRFDMDAGVSYRIVFSEFFNMSYLSHYNLYDGAGGKDGPLNSVVVHDVFLSPLE